jgi:hypothetical protein
MIVSALNSGRRDPKPMSTEVLLGDEYGSEEYSNRVSRRLEKDKRGVPNS